MSLEVVARVPPWLASKSRERPLLLVPPIGPRFTISVPPLALVLITPLPAKL